MNRAGDWLRQAERDLQAAVVSAAADHHEWTAFQAQQAGEKAVKALVQARHGAARGHSITAILQQLSASLPVPDAMLDAARALDQVYVTARYPNGFAAGAPTDYFTPRTSEELLDHGRRLVAFCRDTISRS